MAWIYSLLNLERFPEVCLAVYLAGRYDVANLITVNAGLYFLFSAYANVYPEKREDYLAAASLCGESLETALCGLPLHLPANNDVIIALLLAASGSLAPKAVRASLTGRLTTRPSIPSNCPNHP